MTSPENVPGLGRQNEQGLGRRAVLSSSVLASGAALLAACGSSGESSSSSGSATTAAAGTALAKTSDVPVGGAKIFSEEKVIVTQPTSGDFKCFSNVCPHEGCAVSFVEDAEVVCPCHNSRFDLQGQRVSGPAETGLTEQAVTVSGDEIIAS